MRRLLLIDDTQPETLISPLAQHPAEIGI